MSRLEEGTRLAVGSHDVTVGQFLLEGGFSLIYKVTMDPKEDDTEIGCLKQVIVPDKNGLNTLRKEVDVMQTLAGARLIVKYYDSHAERLENGTYQVLVLMELCPNKSLLDYMNAHIREKLSEKAILKIMKDISLGIYEMHKLNMVHRDIKIENVLIDAHHHFKLGDFGSVSPPIGPPKDHQEFQALGHDILYHTTAQYRAPEMIDLYRGLPIDEKSDIWALGCFLYKLCYYITPFETNGEIAILHASFQFPPAPVYSGDLKNLIIIMLQESPLYRPNIVQIIMLLCKMMGLEFGDLGIDDFYHVGEFNFQALHEMQRHKQNELLKQQQYYYEQQKQQQEYEARQREKLTARSLRDLMPGSSHGSVTDLSRRALSKTPQPRAEPIPVSNSQATHQVQTSKAPPRANDVRTLQNSPVPHPFKSPRQLPQPSHLANSNIPGYPVPSQPKGSAPQDLEVSSKKSGHKRKSKSPVGSHELKSNSSVNSIISIDSSNESEVDINALGNLEDAENRYPSLDALDLGLGSAGTRSNEKTSLDSPIAPVISILKPLGGSYDVEDILAQSNKAISTRHLKKPSQYENIEAWQRLSASINKNAERFIDDVFISRTATNDPQTENKPGSHRSGMVSLESVEELRLPDRKESEQASKNFPDVIPKQGKEQSLNKPPLLSALSNLIPLASSKSVPHSVPVPIPVSTKDSGAAPPTLSNSLPKSKPYSSHPTTLPHEASAYQAKPFKEGKRESSNPWGDTLRKKDSVTYDGVGQNSPFPNPELDLTQQVLQLNLDDQPPPAPRQESKHDLNLIELETGLSSSHSDLAPQFPNTYHEEVSLLDLEIDEDPKRKKDGKPVFKKKISGIQNQPIAFLEEVIDFASDDENDKSEMSRMAIRNSLKKSRKLSDHQHKRSESSHAESRKRLSFFGGAQD